MTSPAGLLSFGSATGPRVAVGFSAERVTAAAIDVRGGSRVLAAHATAALPSGALLPSLTGTNVRDKSAISSALNRVLEHVGKPKRIGLVVPDPVARISVLRFAHVPARHDLDQLIRWQMKKAVPLSLDDAQMSYVEGWKSPEGQDFVVSLARRDVIAEYEAVCASAGAHAGLVDTATLNVVNGLLARGDVPAGDWMLINVAAGYASVVILRGHDPIFFRSRTDSETGGLSDLVHQTTMYYEDRLQGGGLSTVLIHGSTEVGAAEISQVRQSLETRLGVPVETADIRPAVKLSDSATTSPALLDALAPLIGMLIREQ